MSQPPPPESAPEDLSQQAFASRLDKFGKLKQNSFCLAKLGELAGFDVGQQPGCASHLVFREATTGSIEPGKLADLAVIDRDILTCPEDQIAATKVLRTYVGGKLVYESAAPAAD